MIEMGMPDYVEEVLLGRLGFTDDFRAEHPEVVDRLRENYYASNPSALGYLLQTRARQRHETTHLLGEIAHPTLVLYGADDTLPGGTSFHPASSKVLAERIPDATLHEVPGAAHHVFWQIPETINGIILEFLQAH
jgi:pimeloyl-ACP methyl ester carboxylesterase